MRGQQLSTSRRLNRHWQSAKKKILKFHFDGIDKSSGDHSVIARKIYITSDQTYNWSMTGLMHYGAAGELNYNYFTDTTNEIFLEKLMNLSAGSHVIFRCNIKQPTANPAGGDYGWLPPIFHVGPAAVFSNGGRTFSYLIH